MDRIQPPPDLEQAGPGLAEDALVQRLNKLLGELTAARRAVRIPISTAETNRQRWIATENLPLYRAAFGIRATLDEQDAQLLELLAEKGPLTLSQISRQTGLDRSSAQARIARLTGGFHALCLPRASHAVVHSGGSRIIQDDAPIGRASYVATQAWLPNHIYQQHTSRDEARRELVLRYLRQHGPVSKYEIMDRYGFPEPFVERALDSLYEGASVVRGEYVPTKAFPQWCYRSNLEQIHRLTLSRLRREMEPATPDQYADFLARWQHVHPETMLSGSEGLRSAIAQLQGQETYQIVHERDLFPARVPDYSPAMLDRLCYGGEVYWRSFDHRMIRRGRIGFCFRRDLDWVVADPTQVEMDLTRWDDDIPQACDAVRDFLRQRGACFFDDIVTGTGLDWRLVLRAVWHLVWTGEATNDSYESIRHAEIASGLSACYDLGTKPGRKGVTLDFIVRHMLELRKLDPRLGRWAPTERLVPSIIDPPETAQAAAAWADLLLRRHGIVCREAYKREVCPLPWKELRRALVRLELLGTVRRGFFVEDLSGEQFAYPEAIDALRNAKLQSTGPGGNGSRAPDPDESMIALNACDPANPFGSLFPATTQAGEEIKFLRVPQKYLVLQAGRPLLLYEGRIRLLVDLTPRQVERAIQALTQLVDGKAQAGPYSQVPRLRELNVRDWNDHPIDVSPARHLLIKLGFVLVANRWKGCVYDGLQRPSADEIAQASARAETELPDLLPHLGKEKAPVAYDADWIVARSHSDIRDKVQELIAFLDSGFPQCEIVYQPRGFQVRYRGFRCMNPYIQRKQIRLQITHKGWTPGIAIQPDTDLEDPQFAAQVRTQFERTRQQIDALVESRAMVKSRISA
jgi:hypothetical protein